MEEMRVSLAAQRKWAMLWPKVQTWPIEMPILIPMDDGNVPSLIIQFLPNKPLIPSLTPPARQYPANCNWGCSSNREKMILLKDIVPAAQNNIDTKFILLEKGRTTLEGQNKVCLALVADETAAVHFQLWGDECDAFEAGDIIYLTNGIFSYHRSNLVLRAGKRGKVEKIGEFTMSFVETPNMSEIHWIPDPNNPKKYIPEYVISPHSHIFPPIL